jgi:threonine/homoserine/homoserine lactone efflux protein
LPSDVGAAVVRSVNLLKTAAEAELLRLRTMMARQVRRGIFGAVAAVFGVAVLALAEVAGWQALRLKFQPIPTTLILLGINLVIAAAFGVLAARSAPGHTEREALRVRRQALETARGSLVVTAALPAVRLLRGRRTRRRGSWRSFLGR